MLETKFQYQFVKISLPKNTQEELISNQLKQCKMFKLHNHWEGMILFIELVRFEVTSLLLTKILSSKQFQTPVD